MLELGFCMFHTSKRRWHSVDKPRRLHVCVTIQILMILADMLQWFSSNLATSSGFFETNGSVWNRILKIHWFILIFPPCWAILGIYQYILLYFQIKMTRNSKDETDPHHEANHLFFISAPPPCVVWNVWNNEAALDRLQWAATGLDHCRLGRERCFTKAVDFDTLW